MSLVDSSPCIFSILIGASLFSCLVNDRCAVVLLVNKLDHTMFTVIGILCSETCGNISIRETFSSGSGGLFSACPVFVFHLDWSGGTPDPHYQLSHKTQFIAFCFVLYRLPVYIKKIWIIVCVCLRYLGTTFTRSQVSTLRCTVALSSQIELNGFHTGIFQKKNK